MRDALIHGEDHLGIDFGARTAGTTVLCRRHAGVFHFLRPDKGEDVDRWLDRIVAEIAPQMIYIDAPLSLPAAYFGRGEDHFFREADRLAGGMSPMFLGGLTARAIRHADRWKKAGIGVHEAYPAALIRHAWEHLRIVPRRTIPRHKLRLMAGEFLLPPPDPADRHEADAWLCWLIGLRHRRGEGLVFGEPGEGVILA